MISQVEKLDRQCKLVGDMWNRYAVLNRGAAEAIADAASVLMRRRFRHFSACIYPAVKGLLTVSPHGSIHSPVNENILPSEVA